MIAVALDNASFITETGDNCYITPILRVDGDDLDLQLPESLPGRCKAQNSNVMINAVDLLDGIVALASRVEAERLNQDGDRDGHAGLYAGMPLQVQELRRILGDTD